MQQTSPSPPPIPPRPTPNELPSQTYTYSNSTPPYYNSYGQHPQLAGTQPFSSFFPTTGSFFPSSSFAASATNFGLLPQLTGPLRSILVASQQLVQAFYGVAQVLDSAYVTTLASWSATATIVEQLQHLKRYLFARRSISDKRNSTGFSVKPFALFLVASAVIPWLLKKIYAHFCAFSDANSLGVARSKQFAVALHAFEPQQPGDLQVKRDEIVAVLAREASPELPEWSLCRSEDGRVGIVPANHLKQLLTSVEVKNEMK